MSVYCLRCGSYGPCGCQMPFEELVKRIEEYDPEAKKAHALAAKYRKEIEGGETE